MYLGISEVIHRLDNDTFSQLSPRTSYVLHRREESVACRRSLTFAVQVDDPRAKWLLGEFRLIVNKSIRIAMAHDIRSRTRLARVAYHDLSADHRVHKKYILSAFDVALGLLKGHRRRIRKNRKSSPPFVRKPMLIAANQSYWLDRETGRLRIPIRGTEGIQLYLPLSEWHRSLLTDSTWSLGTLTVVPGKIIVLVRKASPPIHEPMSLIALDTNEDSMDGVACSPGETKLVAAPLGGVRLVQATHFRRRRRLVSKKAHDWRVRRRLLAFEGRRERNRVRQRLHLVSRRLIQVAEEHEAAIVLEDLRIPRLAGYSRRTNRRRNMWPCREIHRQIEYKAALAGVPIIKVNPAWTSKTCPVCGARRRDRVGKVFVCLMCDWEMDRQINAGLNILKTALASNEALARAVRFQPGALRHDVVIPLYDLLRKGGGAREEPSGVESRPSTRVT